MILDNSILIIQIATKLIAMQQSLRILTDVPDYADRVNRLETLKNRLEALLSPTVIAAFNTRDVGMKINFSLFLFHTKIYPRNDSIICTSLSIDRSCRTIRRFICHICQGTISLHQHLKALIYYLGSSGYTY